MIAGQHRNSRGHVIVLPHPEVTQFKILVNSLGGGGSAGECSQSHSESVH